MITIVGNYNKINMQLILIILSKKNYIGSQILVNNKKINKINIEKNKITRIKLNLTSILNLTNTNNIKIEIYDGLKIIESIDNLDLVNLYKNISIVNCDSTLGFEKNLWNKLKNVNSHYIIHCGDQIYNDKIFKKYYRFMNLNDKKNIKKLKKEIFNNFYNQFNRYKNILKNNFNLMIPDDHDIVDDAYENKHQTDDKFVKIKNIFKKFVVEIELGLNDDLTNLNEIVYLSDDNNKTIYVLNYTNDFTDELLNKYDFDNKIIPYDKIVVISRKSLLSTKNNILNQIIFSQNSTTMVNIDILLKKIILNNKKMYIFCGDDHSYKKSIITYKKKNICEIITCGPINTVPELFKNEIILDSQIDGIEIKNISYELTNSFIKIQNDDGIIKIKKVSDKKNILFYLLDNVINVINLI